MLLVLLDPFTTMPKASNGSPPDKDRGRGLAFGIEGRRRGEDERSEEMRGRKELKIRS